MASTATQVITQDKNAKATYNPHNNTGPAATFTIPWYLLNSRNTFFHVCAIILSIYFYKTEGIVAALTTYIGYVLLIDFCRMIFPRFSGGHPIPLTLDDVQMCAMYEYGKTSLASTHDDGVDLGFNLYEGDYSRSPHRAQKAKFEFAFRALGLKEGMRVLDVGCGFGDWLRWLKQIKKCKVEGINVTEGQAAIVLESGIKCHIGRWQKFQNDAAWMAEHKGKFDAVTFWDTVEHYCKPANLGNKASISETYNNCFRLANDVIDPESECGRVWISCLHMKRLIGPYYWSEQGFGFFESWWKGLREFIDMWIMVDTYMGMYPDVNKPYNLTKCSAPYFKCIKQWDKTEDYRMTSLVCKNHFGNGRVMFRSTRFLVNLFTTYPIIWLSNPHFPIIFYTQNFRKETPWMWHMGGIEKDIDPHVPLVLLWQVYDLMSKSTTRVDPNEHGDCLPEGNDDTKMKDWNTDEVLGKAK